MDSPEIVTLDRARGSSEELLGPKARNLARLREGGVPVPDGFVVTAAAWRRFADETGLALAVRRELEGLAPDAGLPELRAAARRVRDLHAGAPFPAGLEREVREAYARLAGVPVAVRSSAAEEDRAGRSAAGVFRTELDVRGEEAVLSAIRSCWESLHGEAALAFRLARGLPAEGGAMAVIVQAMVAPEAAGVLFTRSPLGEGKGAAPLDAILVEAVRGRGGALVDGEANPERYIITSEGAATPPRQGSPQLRSPSSSEVRRALLSEDALSALGRAARRVEEILGPAVDIEWAICEGRLAILQARPITALAPRPSPVRWTAANSQEALQDPVAPLTWSLLEPLVERGRKDLFSAAGFREIEAPYLKLFSGRPYFNPDYFRTMLKQVPGAPENVFDALIFGEGKAEVHFRLPEFDRSTFRKAGLLFAARIAARERFELFLALYDRKISALAARDLSQASREGLLDVRRRATALLESGLRRHVLGTAIAGASYLLLDLFLKKTGVEPALGTGLAALLTGGARGNVLTQANERLHDLARIAQEDEAVRRALLEGPPRTAPQAVLELSRASGSRVARAFVEGWRRFLAEHGHRAEHEAELSAPRWAEDPSPVVSVLRSYLAAPLREPPRAREERLGLSARRLAQKVASTLGKAGKVERVLPARTALFWLLYREARRYAPYRENLKAAALRALLVVKRCFLEQGTRLAARGVLSSPDDVFFLEVGEVDAAFSSETDREVVRALVRARRAERARHLAASPPPFIVEGASGEEAAPEPAPSGALRGVPVSPGRVTGTARVLRSLDEAARVRPGDVIVARVVNAAWTPLFVLAGAVVAEMGGVLSHGAIMAREYGIPCVFGIAGVTTRIADGETVTVDGLAGTVTVES